MQILQRATRPPLQSQTARHELWSGEVVLSFKKLGHMGISIESQIGDETAWSFLAIDTSNP